MKKLFLASLALLGSLWAADARAAAPTCILPYVLQNGTIPNATQVMADFYALLACINGGGVISACGANPNANVGFFPVLIETASYTVKLTDQCSLIVYHGTGPATFTLPPPTRGFVFWVINLSSDMSNLTLMPPAGQLNYGSSATVPFGSGGMLDSDGTT